MFPSQPLPWYFLNEKVVDATGEPVLNLDIKGQANKFLLLACNLYPKFDSVCEKVSKLYEAGFEELEDIISIIEKIECAKKHTPTCFSKKIFEESNNNRGNKKKMKYFI